LIPSGTHPRKKTEAVLHFPADQILPLQIEQMDAGLVEDEDAGERGTNVPEDETGNPVAGLRFPRQALQGEFR
jgi:hypothetical protein